MYLNGDNSEYFRSPHSIYVVEERNEWMNERMNERTNERMGGWDVTKHSVAIQESN